MRTEIQDSVKLHCVLHDSQTTGQTEYRQETKGHFLMDRWYGVGGK